MAVNLSDVYQQVLVNRNMWAFTVGGTVTAASPLLYSNYGVTRLPRLVQSVSVPTIGFDTKQNETTKNIEIGKFQAQNEFTITVLDDTEHSIARWYYEWVDQFFDLQNKVYRRVRRPTRDATFVLYKHNRVSFLRSLVGLSRSTVLETSGSSPTFTDDTVQEVKRVRFFGVLPTNVEAIEYNYAASDAPILSVSFVCNQVISSDHPQYYQITGDPPVT